MQAGHSRLSNIGKNRMMAMTTCAYDGVESRAASKLAARAAVDMSRAGATALADWRPSAGGGAVRSTVQIAPAGVAKRLGTGSHWWFSESIHAPIGSKIEFRFQGAAHLLVLYHEGARTNGDTSIDGCQSSQLRSLVRKLTFVPAGCVYREHHETSAATRVTFLYLDPAAFRRLEIGEAGFESRVHFEDRLVWETASKLKNTIESRRAGSRAYLEALSDVLAHELTGVDRDKPREAARSRGGLAGWQKRAVVDHIEQRLGEQVCLLELAELARLSLHHFCRAFKQSFGIPAHQYQVRRRMEAAKLLLADRATSVTDIAFNLGYAQTSSFSNAFRKTTGWTPTAYRREFK
jgi:AraC family transcriptional regulator